ncbi:IS3 family transposase [Clostridium beijerinckii]|uniref:IS3 family transposase n=1 Tax=Clostridium beijerinckii TaxID=1520 RepID=A0A7X9SUF9_CLOBE|nr:IS3 family transposase [Clostridium beijerinckii]NMF07993.1 IS3 family transposase [Clostridium beijerinckii]
MSKKFFSNEEINILSKNKYVKRVSEKGITYTDEFKRLFIAENEKGKFPREIFEECGFDINIIGLKRIQSSAGRWRSAFRRNGVEQLQDTRKYNTGRPSEKDLSLEEKYEKLQAKLKLLQAENELPKKVRNVRKECGKEEIAVSSSEKFKIIKYIIEKYKFKNMLSYMCKISGVSRSGYYRYFSSIIVKSRESNEVRDLEIKENILKAYYFKRRKKGARQIKMTLNNHFNINYNLKRIRRIMKKYEITCPHRKANPYRRMMKATKEHTVLPNLLNREFKQKSPGKVLLTDISYLFFKNGQKAYLSTILDASTNEVLAHNVSKSLKIDIVTNTIDKLIQNNKNILRKDSFIHSDQGVHYTSPIFQNKVKKNNLGQSMSRRGNCWDNAPQESFFGHLKDEVDIKTCETFEDLVKEIDDYIYYYNNFRGQWNLKKMTPIKYRNHLLN